MNVFLKKQIILFIGNLLISSIICDETLELSCTSSEDCKSYENKFIYSECVNKECVCQNRKDKNWIECSPRVSSVSNQSIKSPFCTTPNTEFKNGLCRTKNVHLGKSCEESLQCRRNDLNSQCINDICMCKKHFIEVENVCRSIVKDDQCTKNEQCPENAECQKELCVCKKEFIGSSNYTECLPFRSYKEPCVETPQCIMAMGFGSACKNGTCLCSHNFTINKIDGEEKISCRKNALVGDVCASESDCFSDNLNLYCVDNVCTCKMGPDDKSQCERTESTIISIESGAASIKGFNLLSIVIIFSILFAV
ncbi:prion-like-(Q/N-rich) domain-bearing protein 25 [Chironomus tepperi]|uniref:prion-like-(Q/N-rich) domain-bearing protein 25 n=1 Tax=Chironomus tepperi TaxID=113505 RepID=UPI00391F3828